MPSRELQFSSFDGLELSGTLEYPLESPRARVLMLHGMSADREEWGLFTLLAEELLAHRIASLRVDYRCHGKAAALPTQDLTLTGVINDIDAAYAELYKSTDSKAAPSFLVAASFSGGVAAHWASCLATEPVGVFLCYPVLDYLADLSKTAGDWRGQLRESDTFEYAGMRLGRALANEAKYFSIESAARESSAALTILHGDSDTDVPIEYSRRLVALVAQAELIEIKGADHGFSPLGLDADDDAAAANLAHVVSVIVGRCEERIRAGAG